MLLRRVVCVSLLAFAGLAVAQQGLTPDRPAPPKQPGADRAPLASTGAADTGLERAGGQNVVPQVPDPQGRRVKLPRKQAFVNRIPDDHLGRLTIKATNASDARPQADGRSVLSLTNQNVDDIQAIIERFDLTVKRAINHSEADLATLETRAALLSGDPQPRLGTIWHVEGTAENLLGALREFKRSPNVDWAEWDTVRYTGFGIGNGACCLPDGTCVDNTTFSECEDPPPMGNNGSWQGDGTNCVDNPCLGGACCLPDGNCDGPLTASACQDQGGDYRGDGTLCADVECTGACCRQDGTCFDGVTEFICNASGGTYKGDGTDCDDVACVGACCVPATGSCVDLTESACADNAGAYGGDGTACDGDDGMPDPPDDPTPDDFVCVFIGACCIMSDCVDSLTEDDCMTMGGFWTGPGVPCEDVGGNAIDCNLDCGNPITGDCYDPDGNMNPFCTDEGCCELVCDIDPFCCDDDNPQARWDQFCAATANVLCPPPPGGMADNCISPLNGNCFEPHVTGGCNNEPCCRDVCVVDPFCCMGSWDSGCVFTATFTCLDDVLDPDAIPTPDFKPLQGYLTDAGYDLADIPDELEPHLPTTAGLPVGFGGHGWDMAALYDLGQALFDAGVDATGQGVLTRGKTINVAVIEWGYHPGHEDLDVILEPGQTLIPIPEITEPDHGTATLSIINAKDNGFGVTGIAPQAQGYFFPLTSLEDGPRELSAWTSALLTLGPGDVISASYGPGPPIGNLNNTAGIWTMIRLASDLGITCCIAAGNSCFNVDSAPNQGDSGGIVVGANSPGVPWYRLAFSNFCTDPPADNSRGNVVHVKAWGTHVAAAGYGPLYSGNPSPDRSYTGGFGGTSAAAPQIAGLVACLQGLAKQFYGIPLMPEQIRGALGAPGLPPPVPTRLFGGFPGPSCALDYDPDLGPHRIGPYPVPAGDFGSAASRILNQSGIGFDDAPLIDEIRVLRGNLIYGNTFSIKGSDNNYLVVEAVKTSPNSGTNEPSESGVNPVYLGYGLITDVEVTAHADIGNVGSITILVEAHDPDAEAMMFVEAFDWQSNFWTFGGLTFLIGLDVVSDTTFGGASRFVRASDNKVLIRVWTISLALPSGAGVPGSGFGGTRGSPTVVHYDLITLGLEPDFGIGLPGGPNLPGGNPAP